MMRSLLIFAALAAVSSSGCTLLWLFNNDPAGLPCDFDADPVGACLDGYTCVNEVCIKAGSKVENDPCARPEECASGLACAVSTAVASCADGADDVNCSLLDEDEWELRCRKICEEVDDDTCGPDQRCYLLQEGDVPGVCQLGTCETDTECTQVDALCGNALGGGTNGLCQESCLPLSCRAGGTNTCTGCDGIDGDPDDFYTCVPQAGSFAADRRFVCEGYGSTPDFSPCGEGALCRFGSACIPSTGGGAFCLQWCSVSGAPACDGGTCISVLGDLGLCQ